MLNLALPLACCGIVGRSCLHSLPELSWIYNDRVGQEFLRFLLASEYCGVNGRTLKAESSCLLSEFHLDNCL